MKVLVVDNFDSFTYNLVEYVSASTLPDGSRPDVVVRKNTASLASLRALDPDAVLISPGPGHPETERDVGVSAAVLEELSPSVPTLGVCLGMEAAVSVYGGSVGTAPEPVHGKADPVDHDGAGIFRGLPDGFQGGRYHSLIAHEVPEAFEVTARTTDGDQSIPMGIRHRRFPIAAVQFHPESVLTAVGQDLVENFLVAARDGALAPV